jgi:hypothetical protein
MGVYNQVCLFLDVVNCNWISDAGHDEIAVSSENNVFNSLHQQSNCGSHKGFQETTHILQWIHGKKAKKIRQLGNTYITSQLSILPRDPVSHHGSLLQKYKCISCACKKLFGKFHTPEF